MSHIKLRILASDQGLGTDRRREIKRAPDLKSGKPRPRHADDFESLSVQADLLSDHAGLSPVLASPKRMTENNARRAAASPVVRRSKHSPQYRLNAQNIEKIAAHKQTASRSILAGLSQIERAFAPGQQPRK